MVRDTIQSRLTILLAFLDGSATYAEDSQVGRLS